MKNRYWSSKHINVIDGASMWVRADYAERMRAGLIAAGRIESGTTLVTGGKTYLEFVAS